MTPMEWDYARWIKARGGHFKLRELAGTRFIYEYRKNNTHMRREGWIVDVKIAKVAGSNFYTVTPPAGDWGIVPPRGSRGPGRPTKEEVRLRTEPYLPLDFAAANN